MFCLQSHYRKSLVFSYENLDNTVTAYNKLVAKTASLLAEKDGSAIDTESADALRKRFTDALDNDLNTSLAITALYDLLKAKTNAATKLSLIAEFDTVLGLDLIKAAEKQLTKKEEAAAPSDDPFIAEIEAMIQKRKEAKKAKDYATADAIRKELADKGVTLIDTAEGTKYKIN